MLEKMAEFFDSRIEEYEEHQMNAIRSAAEWYPFWIWDAEQDWSWTSTTGKTRMPL